MTKSELIIQRDKAWEELMRLINSNGTYARVVEEQRKVWLELVNKIRKGDN